jgi:hypothetical protein
MTIATTILDKIPFPLDYHDLAARVRLRPGSADAGELERLVREARLLAAPKALYRLAAITAMPAGMATLDHITFTSRVLHRNLQGAHRAFPFATTCGQELASWAQAQDDMLLRYWADVIMEMALETARQALQSHLQQRFELGNLAMMTPGSLEDWPITQQRPLFTLLGDTEQAIGLRLLDSCLMVPIKSASGILFPNGEDFRSCQLCPREGCPSRRAAYDAGLVERYFKA